MNRRLLGLGVVAMVAVGLAVFGAGGFARVAHLRAEVDTLEHELVTCAPRSVTLTQTIECLRTDPLCIEKSAREDLGMVREGETVLKFPSRAPR